jgi:imidazolonepropionase-like amidohydrolase
LLWSAASEAQLAGTQGVTLFEGATLIPGDGAPPIENSAFVTDGYIITAVGRRGQIQAPAGARRVDLTGKFVIPALVDLHSHLGFVNEADGTQSKENFTRENLIDHLNRFAYAGNAVTVSFGTDFPDFIWDVRRQSDHESFSGARYRTVGRGLAFPGSGPAHPARNDVPYAVTTAWQAEEAVRKLATQEVDFVKIWVDDRNGTQTKLSPPVFTAAAKEALKLGFRPVAHVFDLADAKGLVRAGVEGFTHMVRDAEIDDEMMALLRERPGVWFVPNLGGTARRTEPGKRADWLQDPLLKALLSPAQLEEWGQQQEKSKGQAAMRAFDGVNTAKLHKAGVRLVAGSDAAGGTRVYGWGTHGEMENFVVEGGMTNYEALISATSLPASILGINIGTIAVGRGADFLVLDANPLVDIKNTRRIADVYLRGKRVDRDAMAAHWRAQWQKPAR